MKKKFTDEELADDEEGHLFELEVAPKQRGEVSENSDEDLPEAFTMTEGKSMAQHLRNEQRASGIRIAAEVKKKRQEKAASRKSQKTADKASASVAELEAGDKDDEFQPEQSVIDGLLDDSIVQFLSEREKAKLDNIINSASPPPEKALKVKRAKLKKERNDDGRVQVVDLSRERTFAEEHTALEFKKDLLYGGRLRRDHSMLRKLTRVS